MQHKAREGALFASWKMEQGQLVRTIVQPNEDAILNQNRELQKDPGIVKTLEWGRLALSVPENVYWYLVKKYPDLNAPNAMARRAAWLKIYNDRDYADLRVTARSMARG